MGAHSLYAANAWHVAAYAHTAARMLSAGLPHAPQRPIQHRCCHHLSLTHAGRHRSSVRPLLAQDPRPLSSLSHPPQASKRAVVELDNDSTVSSVGQSRSSSATQLAATEEIDWYYDALEQWMAQAQKVPSAPTKHAGLDIGKWCKRLRQEYRLGLVLAKDAQRVELLPGWTWGGRSGSTYMPFEQHAERINAFCKQHGRMPLNTERDSLGRLGIWCSERRTDHKQGRMSAAVAAAFEQQIPLWTWNAKEDGFLYNLHLLQTFAAEHGRMPTQRDIQDGVNIGRWVNKMRMKHRTGKMPQDQADALQHVPGWWWNADEMYAMWEAQQVAMEDT